MFMVNLIHYTEVANLQWIYYIGALLSSDESKWVQTQMGSDDGFSTLVKLLSSEDSNFGSRFVHSAFAIF